MSSILLCSTVAQHCCNGLLNLLCSSSAGQSLLLVIINTAESSRSVLWTAAAINTLLNHQSLFTLLQICSHQLGHTSDSQPGSELSTNLLQVCFTYFNYSDLNQDWSLLRLLRKQVQYRRIHALLAVQKHCVYICLVLILSSGSDFILKDAYQT